MGGLPSSSTSRDITCLPCEDISVRHTSCTYIVEDTALMNSEYRPLRGTTGVRHHAPITFPLRRGSTIGLRSWQRADER